MEDNTEKHIEIGPVIFKRIRITGKTLCRERHDGTRFTSVIDGKTVDDHFTILHAEDVETGEKYDFNIRHLTAQSVALF